MAQLLEKNIYVKTDQKKILKIMLSARESKKKSYVIYKIIKITD